jgi:hypothetical protein
VQYPECCCAQRLSFVELCAFNQRHVALSVFPAMEMPALYGRETPSVINDCLHSRLIMLANTSPLSGTPCNKRSKRARFPIDGLFQPRDCAGCGRISKFCAANKTPPPAGSRGLHVRSSYRPRAGQMSVFRNIKSKSVGYDRRQHTHGVSSGIYISPVSWRPSV